MMRQRINWILVMGGSAVLFAAQISQANDGAGALAAPAPVVGVGALPVAAKDDVAEIEKVLRPLILAKYPNAEFYRSGDTISIWQGQSQASNGVLASKSQLLDGNEKAADTDNSFFLFIAKHHDLYPIYSHDLSVKEIVPAAGIQGFRFTLRPYHPAPTENPSRAEFQDVPRDNQAYSALQKLANAGLLDETIIKRSYRGYWAMTRYEFAVAIARLSHYYGLPGIAPRVDTIPNRVLVNGKAVVVPNESENLTEDVLKARREQLALALKKEPGLKACFVVLRTEFDPETARLYPYVDVLEQPRGEKPEAPPLHEYVSLGMSSGMSIDASFLQGVERAVAGYAAETASAAKDLSRP